MYTLRLVVLEIMGSWHVSGAVAAENSEGEWTTVATFSEPVVLSDYWLEQDAAATMIEVIRQWSERAIKA